MHTKSSASASTQKAGGAQGLAFAHAGDLDGLAGIGGGAGLVPAEGLLAHLFRVFYQADDGEEAMARMKMESMR